MNDRLPPPADLFLRQLEKALWPLSSGERDAILLELRGHLFGRAAQGKAALAAAIAGLGDPEELAREFAVAGTGEGLRKVGLPGRALVPLQLPDEVAGHRPRLKVRDIVAQVNATRLASRDGLQLVGAAAVATLTGTNFLLAQTGSGAGVEAWPVMIVRVVVIVAAMAAAYRIILSDDREPWVPKLSTFRFATAQVSLLAAIIGAVLLLIAPLSLIGAPPAVRTAAAFAAVAFFSCAAMRVQPWLAALAIDRRDVTLAAAWRGTRGRLWHIVRGWAVLVLPFYLVHILLSTLMMKTVSSPAGQLALAGLDGIAAACALIAAILLNATVFRWAARESIPEPRPFATEPPSDEFVLAARIKLDRLFEASRLENGRL
ncbi:MAG TPA: hypothetical protein VGB59_08300 [Allosphingosinicella sp.]|jgi:hypothetical protein